MKEKLAQEDAKNIKTLLDLCMGAMTMATEQVKKDIDKNTQKAKVKVKKKKKVKS